MILTFKYKLIATKFLLLLILFSLSSKVFAIGEKFSQIDVSAMVVPFCSINANPIAFPTYKANLVTSSTSILITCTKDTKYSISLSSARVDDDHIFLKMRLNSNSLNYQFYQDQKMNRVWGNNESNSVNGIGSGELQVLKVYGSIPANQLGSSGSYKDIVFINLNITNPNNEGNLSFYQMKVRMNVTVEKL